MKKALLAAVTAVALAVILPATALSASPRQIAGVPDRSAQQQLRADSAARAAAAVVGELVARNLASFQKLGLDLDRATFAQALADYLNGKDIGFSGASGDAYIQDRVNALRPQVADTLPLAEQMAYVRKMAAEDGAVTLADGTVMIVLQEGEGPMPKDGDKVTVSYVGKFWDGIVFDDTGDEQSGTVDFNVDSLMPGFTTGLRQMRPGGTYRLIIPPSRAYGAQGIPHVIPGNAALDFTVTLHSIHK